MCQGPATEVTHLKLNQPSVYSVEALINTRTLKKCCALVGHTEVKQAQEL